MLNLLFPLMILTAPTPPAALLCSYGGELYAQTTVEREFADAAWVGRVRVVSAANDWPPDESGVEPWTLYRVQVIERYKGAVVSEMSVFTWRNSGGFYMDRPGAGHDIGGEYLLFLNPQRGHRLPETAKGSMVVNYSCGRSGPWVEVSGEERQTLVRLRGA